MSFFLVVEERHLKELPGCMPIAFCQYHIKKYTMNLRDNLSNRRLQQSTFQWLY